MLPSRGASASKTAAIAPLPPPPPGYIGSALPSPSPQAIAALALEGGSGGGQREEGGAGGGDTKTATAAGSTVLFVLPTSPAPMPKSMLRQSSLADERLESVTTFGAVTSIDVVNDTSSYLTARYYCETNEFDVQRAIAAYFDANEAPPPDGYVPGQHATDDVALRLPQMRDRRERERATTHSSEDGESGGGHGLQTTTSDESHDHHRLGVAPNAATDGADDDGGNVPLIQRGVFAGKPRADVYRFAGRMIGKALQLNMASTARLTRPLFKHLLGWPVGSADMEFVDFERFRTLSQLREMGEEEIEEMYLDMSLMYTDSDKMTHVLGALIKCVYQCQLCVTYMRPT